MSSYRSVKRTVRTIRAALWLGLLGPASRAISWVLGAIRPFSRGEASRRGPRVRILAYHRVAPLRVGTSELEVPPEVFARQLRVLVSGRREVVPISAVPSVLWGASREVVAITFDDGYLDNLTQALPILMRYGVRAAVFVVTGFPESGALFPRMVDGPGPGAVSEPSGQGAVGGRPLTWEEIGQLAAAGVEVHSHGVTHCDLTALGLQEALAELTASASVIEAHLGRRPTVFAYPYGLFTPELATLALEAGYSAACSCVPGTSSPGTPLGELRRTAVESSDTLLVFRARLDGGFDWDLPAWLKKPLNRALLALGLRKDPAHPGHCPALPLSRQARSRPARRAT